MLSKHFPKPLRINSHLLSLPSYRFVLPERHDELLSIGKHSVGHLFSVEIFTICVGYLLSFNFLRLIYFTNFFELLYRWKTRSSSNYYPFNFVHQLTIKFNLSLRLHQPFGRYFRPPRLNFLLLRKRLKHNQFHVFYFRYGYHRPNPPLLLLSHKIVHHPPSLVIHNAPPLTYRALLLNQVPWFDFKSLHESTLKWLKEHSSGSQISDHENCVLRHILYRLEDLVSVRG